MFMRDILKLLSIAILLAVSGSSFAEGSKMTMGNGDKNWIVVEGVTREEGTLTFTEVNIDGNGWLVIHP